MNEKQIYNLNKVSTQIFEKINAYGFTASEADALRVQLANARRSNKRYLAMSIGLSVLMALFAFGPGQLRGYFNGTQSLVPVILTLLCAFTAVLRLHMLRVNARYIEAVELRYTPEREEKLRRLLDKFAAETQLPAVQLTAEPAESLPVTASKLGGKPYLPPGFDYPLDADGKPMCLLAQLNLGELPKPPDFPQTGMLQFYIASDDYYGAAFDEPAAQKNFRVVYHEKVLTAKKTVPPPDFDESYDDALPFDGELRLKGVIEFKPMSAADFRFHSAMLSAYNEEFSLDEEYLPGDLTDSVFRMFGADGHRLGGYSTFAQSDPREHDPARAKYTVTLLQLDSDQNIMWGDAGVAGFFIAPENLNKRDFSDVLYSWDCY